MTDVFLTPHGGHDAAALCEEAAAQLAGQAQDAGSFAYRLHDGWLGDCEEGRGWARLLEDKAVGANSLRWLIQQHVENLRTIADQFRCTTRSYGDADSSVMEQRWASE